MLRMRRIQSCFSACVLLWIGVLDSAASTPDDLLFLGDFEHGVMPLTEENKKSPWYNSGNPPVVVTAPEPVRAGRYAMKSVLDRATSPISFRTEVVPRTEAAKIGQDYWYGFSMYFKDWKADNIWEIVAQWHDVWDRHLGETSRNPILSFGVTNDEIIIRNLWDAKPLTPLGPKGHEYGGSVTLWQGPIDRDCWTDWVVHVQWSYTDDGLTEIWRNGEKIVHRKGPNCFNDEKGPYFKMGIYKGWRDRKAPEGKVGCRVIYHDEVRFAGPGGSYLAVSPPGTLPAREH